MPEPSILTFQPILKEKVWGGRRLAALGKTLPAGAMVGESWEIADLAATSAGGGGGGEARSQIADGPLAGKTLHDAIGLWGELLLGVVRLSPEGGFPMLVKYLDAREHLSVQVHPSPAYAAAHPGAHLKTECWYVLDAEPGSVVFKGVRRGVTRADFERALRSGQGEGVVELLEAVPAVVGDCHNLPSGTVHALGAGVLVAEVQTPSDTTFRVYDWAKEYGRAGRSLHVEEAMACIDFAPAAPARRGGPEVGMRLETEYFSVAEVRSGEQFRCQSGAPAIVMVLAGEGECRCGGETLRTLGAGATCMTPAALCDGRHGAVWSAGPGATLLIAAPKG